MTIEETKAILCACRPNGEDSNDPLMTEALSEASRDAALRRWFDEQQAFDLVITRKLREVAAPPGLKDSILAGGQARRSPARKELVRPSGVTGKRVSSAELARRKARVGCPRFVRSPRPLGQTIRRFPNKDIAP